MGRETVRLVRSICEISTRELVFGKHAFFPVSIGCKRSSEIHSVWTNWAPKMIYSTVRGIRGCWALLASGRSGNWASPDGVVWKGFPGRFHHSSCLRIESFDLLQRGSKNVSQPYSIHHQVASSERKHLLRLFTLSIVGSGGCLNYL